MKTAGRSLKGWAVTLAVIMTALSSASWAQGLPKIAVYVTGDVGGNEKKALGTRMTTALVKSGQYQAVERSEEFLNKLDAEHVKQRSGAIDDGQISALGRQFGVKFVCVADITPAFGEYQVSARIIDVETAGIVYSGDASSALKTMNDLEWVSNQVVKKMFGQQIDEPSQRPADYAAQGQSGTPGQTVQANQVIVIQQGNAQPPPPAVRTVDYYFAARDVMTFGGTPMWFGINVEGGFIWGNGTFLGLDLNFGAGSDKNYKQDGANGRDGVWWGGGINLGSVYDLPVENLELVYGGAAGLWFIWNFYDYGHDWDHPIALSNSQFWNFLTPFVKLRYKSIELSYRGLVGYRGDGYSGTGYRDDKEDKSGFGWNNHQIMVGVYFATSKRES